MLMSILPGRNVIYHAVAAYDANSWVHFLIYILVAAIPVAAWRRRSSVLLCLLIAVLGIFIKLLHAFIPLLMIRHQNVLADMFGVAAGILLGSNIRMLRSSISSSSIIDLGMPRSTPPSSENNVILD